MEKNRDLYGENTITKGQEDSILKKIYESIINPFYDHLTGHRRDFLGDQCLVGKTRSRGSDDFHYHRCPSPHFLVASALSKNSVVIRLRPIYQNDCQHSDCHSSRRNPRSTYR